VAPLLLELELHAVLATASFMHNPTHKCGVQMLLQAGGVQVLDTLLAHMPGQSSSSLLSLSGDDDSKHLGLWAASEDVWVPALRMLSQVAKYSAIGAQIILEVSAGTSLPLLKSSVQCLHPILFGLCVLLTPWALGFATCDNILLPAAPAADFLPAAPPAAVNNVKLGVLVHWLPT